MELRQALAGAGDETLRAGGLTELERICLEALALSASERAEYLDSACSNESMRREAESLLDVASQADRVFEDGIPEDAEDFGATGPYEIQEKLGEGGMGVVFRARQSEPVVREVALKIIRPGFASRQLVGRFLIERQAQAIMDHPNIARVLDAGRTSLGLPYFVMELVSGKNLAAYCEENALGLRERIELTIQVCQAIQHAQQKGIIHRDIKPSNVLVTIYDGKPVPKVIDFGIAKVVESVRGVPQNGSVGATHAGVMLGTFEYASPEQAEAGAMDIDARADVYSLGAMLYQLVCGKTPLDGLRPGECGYAEVLRRIREEAPAPVSQRAAKPELRELDWILAKALEKDRERRYQTADALASDLRRYLNGEALDAGPPSAVYRLRKLAAKFRYWIATAAVLLLLLIASSIVLGFAFWQQRRANDADAALRDVVRRIIIERPAQLAQIPNRTALRGQLMRDAEGALDALGRDARNDSALQEELARANLAIGLAKGPYSAAGSEGDPEGAAKYVRRAVELYNGMARKKPGDVAIRRGQVEALSTWLHLQYRLADNKGGEAAARQLESEIAGMSDGMRRAVQAPWYLSAAYIELGLTLSRIGRQSETLTLHKKALEAFDNRIPADWLQDPDRLENLCRLYREAAVSMWLYEGYTPQAEKAAERAVQLVEGCGAPSCRMRHAQAEGTLGEIVWCSGKRDSGVAMLRKSLAEFEAQLAEDPANAIVANAGNQVRAHLALMLAAGNRGEEAVVLARMNLRLPVGADARTNRGRERALVYRIALGAALIGAKQFNAAERHLRETLSQNEDWHVNHDLLWSTYHLLTKALEAQKKRHNALSASKTGLKMAVFSPEQGLSSQVMRAIAARDYAFAVAHWSASSDADHTAALRALDQYCSAPDHRYGILAVTLLETMPAPDEIGAIRKMLENGASK
ncbi:MAG TPA: serine/threonine-protein kinase [Bryobacteraceae bacterium]|nr:serine/threonine-protein kinase [Bryobacteraceae bacterium]